MSESVVDFYGSRVQIYDAIAIHTPGVATWRQAAVDALDLSPGDTVVDVGCGTGASLPLLRQAVGPEGRVVGIDLTPELLTRARRRTRRFQNVWIVRGDATHLPLSESVDGILASFVVGLLDTPDLTVGQWQALVGSSGRVALLDGVPTGWAHPLDWIFGWFVWLGSPAGAREGVLDRLSRRVGAAHGTLRIGTESDVETFGLGFVRMTAADGTAEG